MNVVNNDMMSALANIAKTRGDNNAPAKSAVLGAANNAGNRNFSKELDAFTNALDRPVSSRARAAYAAPNRADRPVERAAGKDDIAAQVAYYSMVYSNNTTTSTVSVNEMADYYAAVNGIDSFTKPNMTYGEILALLNTIPQVIGEDSLLSAMQSLLASAQDEIGILIQGLQEQYGDNEFLSALIAQLQLENQGGEAVWDKIEFSTELNGVPELGRVYENIQLPPHLVDILSGQSINTNDANLLINQARALLLQAANAATDNAEATTIAEPNVMMGEAANRVQTQTLAMLAANALLSRVARIVNAGAQQQPTDTVVQDGITVAVAESDFSMAVTQTTETESAGVNINAGAADTDDFLADDNAPEELALAQSFRLAFADRIGDNATRILSQNVQTLNNMVAEQFVESVTQTFNNGNREMTLQLHPAFLGRMVITLTMSAAGNMTAKINAANPFVSDALQGQLAQLQNSLRANGVNMESIDISYESLNADTQENHQQSAFQQNQANDDGEPRPDFGLTDVDIDELLASGVKI